MVNPKWHNNPRIIDARLDAHWVLEHWGIADSGYDTLKQLLRLTDIDDMTNKHIRICELLCGPNGWTVYQMLRVRMKDDQPCDD